MFHPTQSTEENADATFAVRFEAGGIDEMCWHLFTWRDRVTVEKPARLRRRLEETCVALDRSRGPEGMNLPGFRLHGLKGRLRGHYAVLVSGNWRVTFRFEDGSAVDVDYVDYH